MGEIPVVIQTALNDYIALFNELLPNTLEGLYIQGSIALNAFVYDSSDIDFVEIEWSVLGLLRQYYTLKEHSIISKLGAGEYGLLHMPEEWHQIIKEAINVRNGVRSEFFASDEQRIDMALKFSKYVISYCNGSLIQKV